MKSKIDTLYIFDDKEIRICQGDIFRDLEYDFRVYKDGNGKLASDRVTLSYVVVLTQDCDLESDNRNRSQANQLNQDKFLNSILVCPAYLAEKLKDGTHLQGPGFGLVMEKYNTDRWAIIKNNKNERYHYLVSDLDLQIPELTIDFKHYFTIPRSQLYETKTSNYVATINELYREALSQRFAYYVSRVGLPVVST